MDSDGVGCTSHDDGSNDCDTMGCTNRNSIRTIRRSTMGRSIRTIRRSNLLHSTMNCRTKGYNTKGHTSLSSTSCFRTSFRGTMG